MAVSESPVNVSRKLVDLRVVDLKLELEKRSLEKTGVKAALIDRLKKALEEEGISNPDEYEFEANDSPVLKKQVPATPVGKKSPRIKEKDKEGEEEEESCEMEEALLEVAAEAVEEGDGSEEEVDLDLDKFMEVDEVKGDEDQAEMKILEDGGEDNLVNDDTIQLSLDEEEKLLDEEEKQLEEKEKATDKKEAEAPSESKQMDSQTTPTKPAEDAGKDMENNKSTGDGSAGSKNVSAPPTPTSVPVVAPLTSDDTLKMDTSGERKDDDLSLIVHVDDTQNDLDSDILGEGLKKEGSVEPKQESTSESDKTQEVKDGGGDASATKVKPAGGEADSSGGAKTTESTPAKAGKEVKAEAGSGAKKETKAGEKKEDDPKKDGDKSKSGAPTKDVKPGEKDVKGSTTKLASSSRNLWVSGLSTSTRATDLKTLFSKHGKVAGAKVVTNARSPGSRCYGYVTMSTAEEASKCIQHLHRTELHGRMISVEKAKGDPAAQAKKLDPKAVAAAAKKVGEAKKDEKDKKPDGKKGDEKKEGDKKDDKKVEKKSPHSSSARRHSSGSGRPRPGSRSGYGHWRDRGHSYHGRPYPPPRIHQSRSPRDRSRTSSHGAHSPGHAHAKTKEPAKDEKETKEGAAETDEKAKDAASSATATPKAETGEKTEETNKDKKVDKKEDILSFEKIKEERERERLKQRERQLREEERRRLGDLERQRQRQREIERRQREEAVRLEREKERLRAERMKLERDRIEAERLERERIRLERERRERERVEREREEAQRRAEQIRFEEQRRAQKRSYESRGPPRDDYYEPKRPTMESRYSDFDHRGRGGYEDRGQTSNGFERRVERYDRRDGRSLESTSRHEPPRRYEDRGPVRDSDTRDRRDQGSSRDRHEMHDRRDHHDRVSHSDRSRVSSHDRMGGPSPRVVSPARRSGDSRSEWKSDRGSMPGPDRRETTRDRAYQDSGNPSSSREWSSGGSDRGSSKAGGSWNQVGQSQSSVGRPSDRWPSSVSSPVDRNGIRPQHSSAAGGMVMNPPMMQGPAAGNAFLASAANIMMGVGLAGSRPQEQRYDAYKNLSSGGGMRRY